MKSKQFFALLPLLIAGYMAMGDGTCSKTRYDQAKFTNKDICGPAAPFYWEASEKGRSYVIYKNIPEPDTCLKRGGTNCSFGPDSSVVYSKGNYTSPILLECSIDTTVFYVTEQFE